MEHKTEWLEQVDYISSEGVLLFREINGVDMTPPAEVIKNSAYVIWKGRMKIEDFKEIYGR